MLHIIQSKKSFIVLFFIIINIFIFFLLLLKQIHIFLTSGYWTSSKLVNNLQLNKTNERVRLVTDFISWLKIRFYHHTEFIFSPCIHSCIRMPFPVRRTRDLHAKNVRPDERGFLFLFLLWLAKIFCA